MSIQLYLLHMDCRSIMKIQGVHHTTYFKPYKLCVGSSIRNVLTEHIALPRVSGINHYSVVRGVPRECTARTRCFAKDFRQGGIIYSFKEKYNRGKAITSLQFLLEPSNIVICTEANLG